MAQAVITVENLEAADHAAWDRFVSDHPLGSPFHLIAWKESIEQTFGYKPFYLEAKQGDEICGVLPLFLTGGFLTGRRLISSPFAVYGGILADSSQSRSLLLERAKQLAADLEVRDLELRNAWEDQCSELPRLSRYVTFTQQIGPEEEPKLRQAWRFMIRHLDHFRPCPLRCLLRGVSMPRLYWPTVLC